MAFTRNQAGAWGGAIEAEDNSTLSASNNIICHDNKAGSGGCISALSSSTLVLRHNVSMTNNTAEILGGAVVLIDQVNFTAMHDVVLAGNKAETGSGGGMIALHDVALALQGGVVFRDNTGNTNNGMGLALTERAKVSI